MKNIKKWSIIILVLLFYNSSYSQVKSTMTILENKGEVKSIQDDIYRNKIKNKDTYVLHNKKIYPYNNFNIVDTLYKNKALRFSILNNTDSIKKITAVGAKSLIIIK